MDRDRLIQLTVLVNAQRETGLEGKVTKTVVCQNLAPVSQNLRHLLRRSVYLCNDSQCIGTKGLAQRLQRSLKHPIPADLLTALFGKAPTT